MGMYESEAYSVFSECFSARAQTSGRVGISFSNGGFFLPFLSSLNDVKEMGDSSPRRLSLRNRSLA